MLSHVPGSPQCRTDHNIFTCFCQPVNFKAGLADIMHPGIVILPLLIDRKTFSDDVNVPAGILYQVKYMISQFQRISA